MNKEELEIIKLAVAEHIIASETRSDDLVKILNDYKGEIPEIALNTIEYYKLVESNSNELIVWLVDYFEKKIKTS